MNIGRVMAGPLLLPFLFTTALAQAPPPATNSQNGPEQPAQTTDGAKRGQANDNRVDNRKTNPNDPTDPNATKDGVNPADFSKVAV